MPAGGQHCGQVVGWHVALLSQCIQNAQDSPLGEIGLAGGGRHQVNQLRQTLTVSCGRTGDDCCATSRRRVHNIGNGPSRSPR